MKFDELLPKIGGFGRFQKLQFSLVVVPIMFISMNQLDLFFQVSTPSHRCQLANYTLNYLGQSANFTSQEALEAVALQPGDSCSRRVLNYSDACLPAGGGYACEPLGVEGCLDGRRFGDEFGATVVTEFDLVCEQSIVATVIKSLSFVGPFFGGIAFGHLSDRFGRRPAFIVGSALMLLSSAVISFSVSVHMFAAVLFVRTFVTKGMVVVSLCLTIEGVDRQHRNSLAYLRNMLRPVSQLLIAGLAYWLRDWRRLTLVAAAPQLLLIVIFFFIAESPVWLASKPERLPQLRMYAYKANRINGGDATQADIDSLEADEQKASTSKAAPASASALGLVSKAPRLRFIAANFLLLVISGLSNSAILFNAEKLSGNFYVNFALLGVSNAGAYLLGWLLADRLGIVRLIRMDILLSVVAMSIVAAFQAAGPQLGWVVTVATQIGKVFLLNANNSVQIYGTQVFPTVARNLASGIIGVAVSVGSLLAPFVLYIGESGDGWLEFLPFLLVAGLLLCGLLLTLILPPVPERLLVTFDDFDSYLAAPSSDKKYCGFFHCCAAGAQVVPIEIPMEEAASGAGAKVAPTEISMEEAASGAGAKVVPTEIPMEEAASGAGAKVAPTEIPMEEAASGASVKVAPTKIRINGAGERISRAT